jgi:AraC family transcriptional regulator
LNNARYSADFDVGKGTGSVEIWIPINAESA